MDEILQYDYSNQRHLVTEGRIGRLQRSTLLFMIHLTLKSEKKRGRLSEFSLEILDLYIRSAYEILGLNTRDIRSVFGLCHCGGLFITLVPQTRDLNTG